MFELFVLHFFDNCLSPGGQAGEIRSPGYSSDTPWILLGYRCGTKIAPKSSGGALGAPQEAFLAASVADRLVHTFLEASGVHFGSHVGAMLAHFSLLGAFFSSFFALALQLRFSC